MNRGRAMAIKISLAASILVFLMLAVGHTASTLTRKDTTDPAVLSAFAAMENAVVPRTAGTSPRTMADFDLGMNLNLSLALVACIGSLGILLRSVDSSPLLVPALLWPILFFAVSLAVTSFVYFYALPAVGLCVVGSLFLSGPLYLLHRPSCSKRRLASGS
jgi:hypothetical protein